MKWFRRCVETASPHPQPLSRSRERGALRKPHVPIHRIPIRPVPFLLLPILLVIATALAGCRPTPTAPQTLPPIEVFFSPRGGCTDMVVRELDAARSSVLVQAYSFTSAPIAKALVDAHKRGVHVEVILDKSQRTEKYSEADFLRDMGIPTLIDDKHAIAHNKVMIIDGAVVITGSFNFTKAAEESNAENLLVIRDPALADRYTVNWQAHAQHSAVYTGRLAPPETKKSQGGKKRPAPARQRSRQPAAAGVEQ